MRKVCHSRFRSRSEFSIDVVSLDARLVDGGFPSGFTVKIAPNGEEGKQGDECDG